VGNLFQALSPCGQTPRAGSCGMCPELRESAPNPHGVVRQSWTVDVLLRTGRLTPIAVFLRRVVLSLFRRPPDCLVLRAVG
jgi:hypothetical protein